jgi:hypothetical protein
MIIVPGPQPLTETRHSRELADRIRRTVRDYQREHPDIADSDVRTALLQTTPGEDLPDVTRRRRIAAAAVAAACAVGFVVMASTGGRGLSNVAWPVVGAIAAALGVAIAVVRFTQRD